MGKEVRKAGFLSPSLLRQPMIQFAAHGLCLAGWQAGRGEDREVRFIPREKPDRDGRGRSVRRGKLPVLEGWPQSGATEPFQEMVMPLTEP